MLAMMRRESSYIYGRHAVLEAIERRPDIILELFVRDDMGGDEHTASRIKQIPRRTTFHGDNVPRDVDKHATHQGFIASIDTHKLLVPFGTFRGELEPDVRTSLVVLGELQDPHNVGAIIRSAAAFGCHAVLIPEHRSAPVTGTVIKVSAGTAFSIPLVSVGNVNTALRQLKQDGFWVYGLDDGGDTKLKDEEFSKPSVFVVGNESRGMRLKTHELCDTVLAIPMSERAESLNASVSAATVLYAWSSQHPESL